MIFEQLEQEIKEHPGWGIALFVVAGILLIPILPILLIGGTIVFFIWFNQQSKKRQIEEYPTTEIVPARWGGRK